MILLELHCVVLLLERVFLELHCLFLLHRLVLLELHCVVLLHCLVLLELHCLVIPLPHVWRWRTWRRRLSSRSRRYDSWPRGPVLCTPPVPRRIRRFYSQVRKSWRSREVRSSSPREEAHRCVDLVLRSEGEECTGHLAPRLPWMRRGSLEGQVQAACNECQGVPYLTSTCWMQRVPGCRLLEKYMLDAKDNWINHIAQRYH